MEHVRVPYGSGSDPIGMDVVALGRGVLSTENRGYNPDGKGINPPDKA